MENQTTLEITISTKKRNIIKQVINKINEALLQLENAGTWLYWDIEEFKQ